MVEGYRSIELPDADKQIDRIVSRGEIIELARELKEKYGLTDEDVAQILDESSRIFGKG